jgi:nucleoside-diphosphate-sugar epimerase
MKKILIIGGGGYIGNELCNLLINKKYKVGCMDTFWFKNNLNKRITKIKKDVRSFDFSIFKNYDVIINLAYLSNDPLCEINARDTWESGPLSTYYMMEACVKYKVKKFIFASSGSIYGLKKEKNVTENLGLDPITDYNKSKMVCEKIIENYKNKIKTVILRPATVCGSSNRLRLDVVLNLFCYQAFFKKKIKILGGKQVRPLLHIKDMINCYEFFIKNNFTGTYNVGFENLSVYEIAKSVKNIIPSTIQIKKSNDPRSYRMNSNKLIKKGFKQKYNHKDAILDLKNKFENGFIPTEENWNLNWLLKKKVIKKSV